MKLPTAPARGMRDLLPEQMALREHAARVLLDTYARYGFRRIDTPIVEHLELLTSGDGGENEGLIYKLLKRGEKLDLAGARHEADVSDLGLRYDLTVPLARFYAHNRGALPDPFKSLQLGSAWRAERPQKGRYRQFTQCDIDVIGDASPAVEVELIQATTEALAALGLSDFAVRLNDRALLGALVEGCGFASEKLAEVFIAIDKLDKIGVSGVKEELRRTGAAQDAISRLTPLLVEGEAPIEPRALAERLAPDWQGEATLARLDAIRAALAEGLAGGELRFDTSLVRGMGYYTGPIFEVLAQGLRSAVAGGGRYDGLVGRLVGRAVPACGFSVGFERVVILLEELGVVADRAETVALLYDPSVDPIPQVVGAASGLRGGGRAVSLLPRRPNTRRQLSELSEQGFDGFAIFEPGAEPEVRPLEST